MFIYTSLMCQQCQQCQQCQRGATSIADGIFFFKNTIFFIGAKCISEEKIIDFKRNDD